jgi:alanine transaminase
MNFKLLVVINPGNPTGQVLSLDTQKRIINFAHKNCLVLLADEVYHYNIYIEGQSFNSFRAVN